MPDPRIVTITDSPALLQPAVEHLAAAGVEVRQPSPDDSVDAIVDLAIGSPSVIVGLLKLERPHFAALAAAGTGLIVRAGIGYDNVDVPLAAEHGILVANVPDYCVDEVADHTMLLMLAAVRRLPVMTELATRTFDVANHLPPVHRIRGQRLGIVGYGRIGQQVAACAAAFGFEVVVHDPFVEVTDAGPARAVSFDELLATSDVITLHALSPGSAHLIDAAAFAAMKPGTVLVNTSRGALVDLDALDAAIANGTIAAASLDVLDGEPIPPLEHPVLARPETLLTPHVAWYSLEARRALAIKSAEEALRWLDGQPILNSVSS